MTWSLGPTKMTDDQANGARVNPELLSDGPLAESSGRVERTNGGDVQFGQLRHSVLRSPSIPMLSELVPEIISMCSNTEVIGVDATRDITGVQHDKSIGDCVVVRIFPFESVDIGRSMVDPNMSVPGRRLSAKPNPTAISDGNPTSDTWMESIGGIVRGSHGSTPSVTHASGGDSRAEVFRSPNYTVNPGGLGL